MIQNIFFNVKFIIGGIQTWNFLHRKKYCRDFSDAATKASHSNLNFLTL